MKKKDYSFLKQHFAFETFECLSNHKFEEQVKNHFQKININPNKFRYVNVFYEKETAHIFDFKVSDTDDFNNDGWGFYLAQLPTLKLSDVAYLFVLLVDEENLRENVFILSKNYPSEFCKELLKETYGYVVYNYQFAELINACFNDNQNTNISIAHYLPLHNSRVIRLFDKVENMYLPGGYSLSKLLNEFNLINNGKEEYGFIVRPNYELAWQFIKRAEKYLS